jgi:hypothetical protein
MLFLCFDTLLVNFLTLVINQLQHSQNFFSLNLTNGPMEQHALKNVNNCLNINIYSYLETSGGQSSNLY